MKNESAMQELLIELKAAIELNKDGERWNLHDFVEISERLLEKEKNQIIEAFKRGEMVMGKSEKAEQYYNDKYKNTLNKD